MPQSPLLLLTEQRLSDVADPPASICHISAKDRQSSRSLEHIEKLESLVTSSDGSAEDLLLVWHLARMVTTSQLLDAPPDAEAGLPGFSAFCADLHPYRPASIIGYLPLIAASPTDPTVLKEEMKRLVRTSHALGDKYSIPLLLEIRLHMNLLLLSETCRC